MASTNTVQIGPWGGSGGSPWNFQTRDRITGFKIRSGDVIDSIAFTFRNFTTQSPTYGGLGGSLKEVFFGNDETITKISGKVGAISGSITGITYLAIETNKTTYGPYGRNSGTDFSVPIVRGTIVGFFGRSGTYLDSIGIQFTP